jgi:type IV pilus biogenesis protein CpaD/CtpE
MKRALVLLPIVLTFAVSACQWNRNAPPLGRDFGNANNHNMSQHIINPDPVTAGYGAPALDGERAGDVIERYKGGSVLEPEAESTGGS